MTRLVLSGWIVLTSVFAVRPLVIPQSDEASGGEAFLSWDEKRATAIGKAMREDGRVGGWFDARVIHTEHSYNYKLRATWLTPEVIRASARLAQIRDYLTPEETRQLVAESEAAGDTVILVEIDPREGSGIIPGDWLAVLQPTPFSAEVPPGRTEASRSGGRLLSHHRRGLETGDRRLDRAFIAAVIHLPAQPYQDLTSAASPGRKQSERPLTSDETQWKRRLTRSSA